jgi:hypothetical protein
MPKTTIECQPVDVELVAGAAHDEQFGVAGLLEQDRGRMALGDDAVNGTAGLAPRVSRVAWSRMSRVFFSKSTPSGTCLSPRPPPPYRRTATRRVTI